MKTVIIVADTGRFKRVEDRKRAGVVGALLDVVFNVAEPLGLWQSVENVGIAYWQNFKSLVELKLS